MSTEIERRVKTLENKIGVAIPCRHPLPVLMNPSEQEIQAMVEALADCPTCSRPSFNGPSMLIINLDGGRRNSQ